MGDFNYPDIQWSSSVMSGSDSSPVAAFLMHVKMSFLFSLYKILPDLYRGDQRSSLLDLVLTTIPDAIDTITHLAPLRCSDHGLATVVELFVFVSPSPT